MSQDNKTWLEDKTFRPSDYTLVSYHKKAVLSQRWPRNAPYIRVPWKFSGLTVVPQNRKPKKRRKINHVHTKLKSVWSVNLTAVPWISLRPTFYYKLGERFKARLPVNTPQKLIPPESTFFCATFLLPTEDAYSCANFPTILYESQIAVLRGCCEPPILGKGDCMGSIWKSVGEFL